ncbi:hypothetical protein OG217_24315 [Streptomyces sp. NBC_01023]|uniref:hypothetical protein n=1 Tax=Streptomyces sp. NBC_01023 TaxID=2903724 RepID=UPI00386F6033|nr:hypothetical protein OG217_24315 [Streptomyces sp. NBC_01023]
MGKPVEGSNGGDFSGINPERLKETISALERDQKTLHSRASYYKQQFDRYGIPTAGPNRLMKIAGWADGELPMLRRRHHLALNMEVDFPGFKGMTQINENDVSKSAVAQARKDGRALGEQFKKASENGDVPSEDLFHALDAHSNDADFVNSFYKTLGPDRLAQLSNKMASNPYDNRYEDHPDQLAHDRNLIAKTLGTFSQTAFEGQTVKDAQVNWGKWLDKFVSDPNQGFSPERLLPLLKGGTFDKGFLVALGDRVFSKKKTDNYLWMNGTGSGQGPWNSDHYAQLFTALSKNPEAAGEWMDHNPKVVDVGLYPGGITENDSSPERAKEFVKVLRAGTIGIGKTDPALAEKNTAMLVVNNFHHQMDDKLKGIHALPGAQVLYSELMVKNWDAMEGSITSPAQDGYWNSGKWDYKAFSKSQNPDKPGIEVSPDVWQAFMQESIREPHAAGAMSALFDTNQKEYSVKTSLTYASDNDAKSFNAFKQGLMGNFYATAYDATEKALGDDAQAWADGINGSRDAMIDDAIAMGKGAKEGGAAGAATAAAGIGQGLAMGMLTKWLKDGVDVKPSQAPKDLLGAIKALKESKPENTWRSAFSSKVAILVEHNFDPHKIPDFEPVTYQEPSDKTKHVYTGNPWGDPKYITSPENDFVKAIKDNDGEVDVSKMTPRQREAYSSWLADPAVVAKFGNDKVWLQVLGQK